MDANGLRIGDGGAFEKHQPNNCTSTSIELHDVMRHYRAKLLLNLEELPSCIVLLQDHNHLVCPTKILQNCRNIC